MHSAHRDNSSLPMTDTRKLFCKIFNVHPSRGCQSWRFLSVGQCTSSGFVIPYRVRVALTWVRLVALIAACSGMLLLSFPSSDHMWMAYMFTYSRYSPESVPFVINFIGVRPHDMTDI